MSHSRPILISIIAFILMLIGAVNVVIAFLFLFFKGFSAIGIFEFALVTQLAPNVSGLEWLITLVFGLLALFIGWGLWSLHKWAWALTVIYFIFYLLNWWLGTLIALFMLIYLFIPRVRKAFH